MVQRPRKLSIDEAYSEANDVTHTIVDMLESTLDEVTNEIATGLTLNAYSAILRQGRALNDDLDDALFDLRALMARMAVKNKSTDDEMENYE